MSLPPLFKFPSYGPENDTDSCFCFILEWMEVVSLSQMRCVCTRALTMQFVTNQITDKIVHAKKPEADSCVMAAMSLAKKEKRYAWADTSSLC